jgi:broad specificity phosphatase PhoE
MIGLVTHADVIKAAVCRSLGLPFDMLHEFEIAPASVTTLVSCGRGFRVVRLNERPEIPGDLTAPGKLPASRRPLMEAVA